MARYTSSRLSHKAHPDPVSSDRGFLKLIEGLEATLNSLDEKKSPAVQEILAGDWLTMSGKVVKKMEYFLSELLVVRPLFCKTVIRELITKFIVCTAALDPSQKQDELTLQEQKMFAILHRNLQKIFEAFPMFEEYGVSTMSSLFPYMTKGPHVHFCYVTNLLTCIKYMPGSKMQILHIILNKLCKIDATIPRQDVEMYSDHIEAAKELADRVKLESGGYSELILERDDRFVPNPLIETLDVCLELLFQYLESEFKPLLDGGDRLETKKAEAMNYFKFCLSRLFEREILPSFGISHVQFLFFFLTSHQSEFAPILLDWLWKKVDTVGTPMVLRVQAMSHISGVLSRAQFVTIKTVKRWLSKLSDWANEYVSQKSLGCHWSTINLQSHGCFYAVCQTIFYVIAFRNKELLGNRKSSSYMRTLNLGRLITCDLNPLKACSQAIADAFVDAANQHQISYCRTILERNQRSTLPTMISEQDDVGNSAWQVTSSSLETFFPYDPFLLNRTRRWIDPIYRKFDPYLPEVKIEKEERERLENGQLGDSSEMMELSCSFTSDSSFPRASLKSNNLLDSLEFFDM